jgi:hypothetical protein
VVAPRLGRLVSSRLADDEMMKTNSEIGTSFRLFVAFFSLFFSLLLRSPGKIIANSAASSDDDCL